MRQLKSVLLLFVTVFVANASMLQAQQSFDPGTAHYIWPTDASPYLTSTFAETRSAHFHAALDIKTWGRRGYKIFATRSGIVDRIAIGPRGYGKVIYLKHSDGSYSVYAHLLSFSSRLQKMVDSIRISEGYKFEIERFWGWKNIKVEQGEVIGYSGASGIGPPHLHFELRTPTHKPFNPLLTNLSVQDDIAPEIRGIAIEPLSPQSSIEGNNSIYTQNAQPDNGRYTFGTIETSGPVGLSVNVFDQSNQVNNAYAVHTLRLSLDGKVLFKTKADSFSYAETDQMFLDRIYPLLKRDKGSYQRLYITDGNTLPFYETARQDGILDLPPGSYQLDIQASDFNGNSSVATLNLKVTPEDTTHPDLQEEQNNAVSHPLPSPHHWDWFSNWLTLAADQFRALTIATGDSSRFIKHRNTITTNLKGTDPLFIHIPGMGGIPFRRVKPGSSTIVSSGNQQHFALFPRRTFYDTVSVGMTVSTHTSDSITVEIIPEAYPLRNAYSLYSSRDSTLTDTTNLSYYKLDRFDKDEKWELIPTTFSDNFIIGETESLGTFVTLRDTVAPELRNPRLRQRPDGKWIVLIDATDNLSGIDYQRANMFVNGEQGIAEFEPEDDRFVYYHPDFSPADSMNIEITVYDKMGNKKSAGFHLNQTDQP